MSRTYLYGEKGDAPGTRVRYTSPDKPARTSAFGATLHAGAYPKGPTGRVLGPYPRDLAERVLGLADRGGGFVGDIQACLAGQDFFGGGKGAGLFFAVRVTDGGERQASLVVFDRDVDVSYAVARSASKIVSQVGTLKAANGGRWGGSARAYGGKVADVSAAISGSDFDTGLTGASWPFKDDELVGFTFALQGETRTWVISGNDDAGIIEVSGDLSTVTATDGRWRARAENVDSAGAPRGLAAIIRDGTQDPDGAFRLSVIENRRDARVDVDNLDIDPTSGSWFQAILRESLEVSQYEVTADAYDSGVDPTLDEKKPANWAGLPLPGQVTANTVKFRVLDFQVPSGKNGYVASLTNGGAMVPHKYVLTVKAGATEFTIVATDLTGNTVLASGLADGTIGAAYAAPHSFLSGFTLTNGAVVFDAGDIITIYVRPLPVSAGGTGLLPKLGGWLYPFAYAATGTGGKDITTRYRVYSNTYDTVTLGPNDDCTDDVVPPSLPVLQGATAWDTTKDTLGKTFIYQLQGAGAVTLTMTGHATQTVEQARDELNVLAGAGAVVFFVSTRSGHKYLDVTTADGLYGPAYNLKATTGTLNAVAGYTDNTTATGVAGTVARLEFAQDLEAGCDGVSNIVAATHFGAVWDSEASPILVLRSADIGCLEMSQPGVTDVTSLQALIDFAQATGWLARIEVPSTILTETAMRAWLRANLTPNDFFRVMFPSFGYRATNPFGARTRYLSTMTGARHGVRAKYAEENQGPHKAATDTRALLSPIFSSLPTDLDNGQTVPLDTSLINGFGVETARHVGPSIYVWGGRIPGENWQWGWGHKVECLLHIKQELLSNGDPLAFSILGGPQGQISRQNAVALVKGLLKPKEDAGWFKTSPEVKADDTNNPPAVENLGRLVCDVAAEIVDTAETIEFRLGEKGVSASGGTR